MNEDMLDSVICPNCSQNLIKNDSIFICNSCLKQFPIKENIAILVPDIENHSKSIEKLMSEDKKKWYTDDQIHAYDEGPYKVHLLKRIEFVKKLLADYIKNENGKKIIDLGCGDGANLRWLSEYSHELYGADYNFLRLSRAEKNLSELNIPVKFFLTDILTIPFKEDFFDIIFFNHVIEHIKEDFCALQNIHKITKKGGLVIIGTPNEGASFWQFAYKIEPRIKRLTDHVNFYTADSFCELAKKAGFKIKHVEHMGWGIPVWSLDMRIRKNKNIDNFLEKLGKRFFKKQATSLYIILEK